MVLVMASFCDTENRRMKTQLAEQKSQRFHVAMAGPLKCAHCLILLECVVMFCHSEKNSLWVSVRVAFSFSFARKFQTEHVRQMSFCNSYLLRRLRWLCMNAQLLPSTVLTAGFTLCPYQRSRIWTSTQRRKTKLWGLTCILHSNCMMTTSTSRTWVLRWSARKR